MTQIAWSYSQAGPLTGYKDLEDEPLQLHPGSAVWLRVFASSEDSDADARHAVANLVAPITVELAKLNQKTGAYERAIEGSSNEDVGPEVKFSIAESRWFADYTLMVIYLLVVPADVSGDFMLLYSISHELGSATSTRRVKLDG
jgi:hypothetical protein